MMIDCDLELLAQPLGVRVHGWDLRYPTSEVTAQLTTLLADHFVVIVAEQKLDPVSLRQLGDALGQVLDDPYVEMVPEVAGVVKVIQEADEPVHTVYAGGWHSDWSFLPEPPIYSALYAVEVPAVGGTTAWANMNLVFETLSPGLKAFLRGSQAMHSGAYSFAPGGWYDRVPKRSMRFNINDDARTRVAHPCVIREENSGRESLFVNRGYTVAFENWTVQDSRPLLDYLFNRVEAEEHTLRYQWRPGDLAVWDNRFTCHRAVRDYHQVRREMIRTSIRQRTVT